MTDFKENKRCGKERPNWKDFLQTALTVAIALVLFAIVSHELGKPGGALDHALGVTAQEIQSASK